MAQTNTTTSRISTATIVLIVAVTIVAFIGIFQPSTTLPEAVLIAVIAIISNGAVALSEWLYN